MSTANTALPAADLLPVSPRANLPYRLVRLIGIPLLRLCFRFDVTGRENIPRSGNYIVIANHLGWLDEFTLLLLFPVEPRLHFLADPTILVTRKFQWWLVRTTGGYVPVVRERHGDRALFRHVERCLELGGAVAIFPEANYGPKEGELMPFHKGFAHFAIKAGVPVGRDRRGDPERRRRTDRADRARLSEDAGAAALVRRAVRAQAPAEAAHPPFLSRLGGLGTAAYGYGKLPTMW